MMSATQDLLTIFSSSRILIISWKIITKPTIKRLKLQHVMLLWDSDVIQLYSVLGQERANLVDLSPDFLGMSFHNSIHVYDAVLPSNLSRGLKMCIVLFQIFSHTTPELMSLL